MSEEYSSNEIIFKSSHIGSDIITEKCNLYISTSFEESFATSIAGKDASKTISEPILRLGGDRMISESKISRESGAVSNSIENSTSQSSTKSPFASSNIGRAWTLYC